MLPIRTCRQSQRAIQAIDILVRVVNCLIVSNSARIRNPSEYADRIIEKRNYLQQLAIGAQSDRRGLAHHRNRSCALPRKSKLTYRSGRN